MRSLSALPLVLLILSACDSPQSPQNHDWPVYKADSHSSSYSSLDQIDKTNVSRLELAWEFRTGDTDHTIECSPIVVDGVMYVTSPMLDLIALNAATGDVIWRFNPSDNGGTRQDGNRVNRGVAYWEDGADRRIYYAAGTHLFAVDASTGTSFTGFGDAGNIDLTQNLSRDAAGKPVSSSTPPTLFEDLLIVGSSISDGSGPNPPGDIRAFNLHTGDLAWTFHTIPHPGEFGYDTWPPDAWKTLGGANSWAGITLDEERGIAFVPTGSPTFDHHGLDRHGANLFANSVIALDARTGERIWHFQAVHHDLWDYDLGAPPNLVSFDLNGVKRDAVAQTTKMGHLFVLDRETGEPIFPIEEKPVPQSTIPGEKSWPTQPFPPQSLVYAKQGFTEADITDLSPEAAAFVKEKYFDPYGPSVLFQPPSTSGDLYMPQFNGGSDWGGAAFDPETGTLYVNASNEAEAMTMLPAPEDADHHYTYVGSGHEEIYDPEGFPISTRPWGTLNAIDLTQGGIAWQVTLGTYPELEKRGLPPTGTFNMGGPVVTAGGLVFIAATRDERIRAFDKDSGEVLWEYQLPFGGYATPATYMVDGRQYVVIAAGGGGKAGTKPGDAYLAFALGM